MVNGLNLRETIEVEGINSRQRAELLILRLLIEAGDLPPLETLRLYLSEAVTPFAKFMQARVPRIRCSEYLPSQITGCEARCPTATSAASAYHRLLCSA